VNWKLLWFEPIIANVTDYNLFSRGSVSLDQVGTQANTFDRSAARFGLNLRSMG
jgi:hypothetical protein